MAAIAGLIDFDVASIRDRDECVRSLNTVNEAMAWLGPDGSTRWYGLHSAMVYRPFLTTPDDQMDRQPYEGSDAVIGFDGRLDNRTELAHELGCARSANRSEVLYAAYRHWDVGLVAHLRGDFALSIWDQRRLRLIMARDGFGARPLYYACRGSRVWWASLPDFLLKSMSKTAEIDWAYIAGYIVSAPSRFLSPFQGVVPVPPGHSVTVDRTGVRIAEFWSIWDHVREEAERSDQEYEEEFCRLFFDAVRRRLRSMHPVVAELSGGLDSSSIVCAADSLIASEPELTSELLTYSYVFDRASRSDERRFISVVEGQRGKVGIHSKEDDAPFLSCWVDPLFTSFPNQIFVAGGKILGMVQAMQSHNARVLLSGAVGDHVLMSEERMPLELADLLQRGRIASLLNRVKPWSSATRLPAIHLLWTAAIRPWLSGFGGGFGPSLQFARIPLWFSRRLRAAAGAGIDTGGDRGKALAGLVCPSKRQFCSTVEGAVASIAAGYGSYYTTLGHFETRFPYIDQPLVEFLIGAPTTQLCRPNERRSLQRRALRNVLPSAIAQRKTKGAPAHAFSIAFAEQYPFLRSLVHNSIACEYELTERDALVSALDDLRRGDEAGEVDFLRFITLEVWLRALHGVPLQWQQNGVLAEA